MMTGARVAEEARQWVETPFVWGQATKGRGCDCKGLVAGVARELELPEAESVYALWSTHRPDRPVPNDLLKEGLASLFDPVDVRGGELLEDGMVLLLQLPNGSGHLAIVTENGTRAVHAQIEPNDKVKETSLRAMLKVCRLMSAWRWREVARDA
jgi:cell wall-associated NlpC family hydrolase